jgi:hypothetical protein
VATIADAKMANIANLRIMVTPPEIRIFAFGMKAVVPSPTRHAASIAQAFGSGHRQSQSTRLEPRRHLALKKSGRRIRAGSLAFY